MAPTDWPTAEGAWARVAESESATTSERVTDRATGGGTLEVAEVASTRTRESEA